jgi:hypothetical protein
MDPPPSKKWADWTDDDPWDPPPEYAIIDKNGIKVSYTPPHLRKKPADKNNPTIHSKSK